MTLVSIEKFGVGAGVKNRTNDKLVHVVDNDENGNWTHI